MQRSFTKQLLFLSFLGVFVLFAIVAVFLLRRGKGQAPSISFPSIGSAVVEPLTLKKQGKFEVSSQLWKWKIDFASDQSTQELEKIYEDVGVWRPNTVINYRLVRTGVSARVAKVEKVKIIFSPKIPDSKKTGFFFDDETGYSYSVDFSGTNDSTMEVFVYVSPEYIGKVDAEQLGKTVSSLVAEAGYMAVKGKMEPGVPVFESFMDIVDEIFNFGPSFFSLQARNVSFHLIPQAYAQSCSGSVYSGTIARRKGCSGAPSVSCFDNDDCQVVQDLGTCESQSAECVANGGSTSCAWQPYEEVCAENLNAGGGNNCTASNTCRTNVVTPPANECPYGQIKCGGCIGGCRNNSQTCNDWIAAECSTGGGGGGGGGNTGSCTWCTGPEQCSGTWEGAGSSWCNAPLGGCCVGGGGGGGGETGPPPPPPCRPSCGRSCGQGDGCGGTCPSGDEGSPGTPTISDPITGADHQTDATNRVTLRWNATSKADGAQIEAYPTFNPGGIDFTAPARTVSSDPPEAAAANRQKAFDTSNTSYWASTQKGSAVSGAAWIGQDFTGFAPRQLAKFSLTQHATARYQIDSVIVGHSDDGVTWTPVLTQAVVKNGLRQEFAIPPSGTHRYWRVLANGSPLNAADSWLVRDIDFILDGPVVPKITMNAGVGIHRFVAASREYTARVRAVNNTCSNEYSGWSPWVSFYVSSPITGSVYLDSNSVATLTGTACTGPTTAINASGGDVTTAAQARSGGNANATTYAAGRAFDNNAATAWGSSQRGLAVSGGAWIGQDFGADIPEVIGDGESIATQAAVIKKKHIRKLILRQYSNAAYDVNSIRVEWSDDGSSWSSVQTLSVPKNGTLGTHLLESSGAHRYWRVVANQNLGTNIWWIVMELEMRELEGGDVGTLTVQGRDWQNYSDESVVDQSGGYSVHVPYSTTGTNQVALIINSGQFVCSCPVGCVYGGLSAPTSGINFYVTDAQHPWFQIKGGSIVAYQANGTAINNPIPTVCTEPTCKPYMITRSNGADTSGFAITGGGDIDLRFENGVQDDFIDEDGRNRFGKVASRASQERYEYFTRLYKMPVNPQSDFGAGANEANEPTGTPVNTDMEAYFHDGDMTTASGSAWLISSGESRVIFVDGDLEIRSPITVEVGGFLAFIVKGKIIVAPWIGHDDVASQVPVLEGMYVANGQINFPSVGVAAGGDKKFVGAGTFVGWGGITMERDYDNGVLRRLLNNENPTELFIYRPDLVLNVPTKMRAPHYQWREVAP